MRSTHVVRILVVASLAIALPLASVVGCAGGVAPTIAVAVALAQASVGVGDTTTATATVTDAGVASPGQTVTFGSSNTAVATVAANAVTNASGQATVTVTAVAAGTTTISATCGGVTNNATLTVTNGGGGTTTVALTLGAANLVAGQNTTATAAVQVDGADAAGVSVTFASSDPAVATVSAATETTDAAGQAQVTVNAVSAGTATITATANAVNDTANLAVTAAPVSRVTFWNATDLQFQVAENEPGATPGNLDLGGIYFLMGAQRHGSLVFVTQAGYTNPQIRNLATGISTEFEPATFSMWAGGLGFKLADISTDGQKVVWIRHSGGTRQIVRADIDGSNEVVLVNTVVPALEPARVAISPDGSEVAYITSTGLVRRISMAGGASVFLNLNGSTGVTAIDWRDNENLVVGCNNALGTGKPGLITVPRDVSPASILFNDGGAGLRSVPAGVATDPDGNILFDELDAGLTQREIYRVDPPGLAARIGIVTRAQNDYGVSSLVY
ncbi:MAG: hypothetical protein GX134_14440 [candidate division WS1 bacterium]|nr:hypothetical protein [candidate division WS1 bacterium]